MHALQKHRKGRQKRSWSFSDLGARTLTSAQQNRILTKVKPFAGQKFDASVVPGDAEAAVFPVVVEQALLAAGWSQIDWNGGDIVLTRQGKPVAGMGAPQNVIIAIPPDKLSEFGAAAVALAHLLQH